MAGLFPLSPVGCWVALAPKAEWAGGAPAPLEQWHYSTRGSTRSVQWSPGSAKTSHRRGRSYTAPGLHSPRRCRVKKKNTHVGRIWIGMSRSTRGEGSASPAKFACGGGAGLPAKKTKKGASNPLPPPWRQEGLAAFAEEDRPRRSRARGEEERGERFNQRKLPFI